MGDEKINLLIEKSQLRDATVLNKDDGRDIIRCILKSHEELREQIRQTSAELKESASKLRSNFRTKLEPPSYRADHESVLNRRYHEFSGNWIVNDPDFSSWVNDQDGSPIFYLHGKPGSGKILRELIFRLAFDIG